MLDPAVYQWEWDCRVILGLGDTPSQTEVDKAYEDLCALNPSRLSGLSKAEPCETRTLQLLQDAYEHLSFLVRSETELPSIPPWVRQSLDRESKRPRRRTHPPLIIRQSWRPVKQPAQNIPSPAPAEASRAKKVVFKATDRFQPPKRTTDTPQKKDSSQQLYQMSSANNSVFSVNSVITQGSQLSDSSVTGALETLEAIKYLMTKTRKTVEKRKTDKPRFTALRGRHRTEAMSREIATNKSLLAIIDGYLMQIEHHKQVGKAGQAPAEFSLEDQRSLLRLHTALRKELKGVARINQGGAERLVEKLKGEDYAGHPEAVLTPTRATSFRDDLANKRSLRHKDRLER